MTYGYIAPEVFEEMTDEVFQTNLEKGWYESDRTFGDNVALLHSEVSEMLEAYREIGLESKIISGKPEGVGSEAADVLIRLLDTCRRYDINLYAEYSKKMTYNKTRPHKHGGKNL